MTVKKFVNAVVKTVIESGVADYQEALDDAEASRDATDPYWIRLMGLYGVLSPAQRKVLLEIMRQVEIDTVSEIFGILDGSSQLDGRFWDFELFHTSGKSRVRLNVDLQDFFLEKIQLDERRAERRRRRPAPSRARSRSGARPRTRR